MDYINEMYVISGPRLAQLLRAELELAALEQGGVDNWGHYCDAKWEYLKKLRRECKIPDEDDFYFEEIASMKMKNYKKLNDMDI